MQAYLGDEMAETLEENEELHRQAMVRCAAWQADQRRRLAEYDARVDAYHASLRETATPKAEIAPRRFKDAA